MDQEMDSAVERQKSQPRTSHLSLIHYFTMLWKVQFPSLTTSFFDIPSELPTAKVG